MIQKVKFSLPEGLRKEVDTLDRDIGDADLDSEIRASFPSDQSLINYLQSLQFYSDLTSVFTERGDGGALLDMGAGLGLTSVYLALLGYDVTSIDPSLYHCRHAVKLAKALGAGLEVVHATSESAAELKRKFDCIVFHSSLHHCDDPVLALMNSYGLLRENGRIFLLCEPILHRFCTRKSFYRRLARNPELVGYGGNEHTYRLNEYLSMIREAGFKNIHVELSRQLFIAPRILPGTSRLKKHLKCLFYGFVRLAHDSGVERLFQPLLDWMSLGPRVIIATKRGGSRK